MQISSYKDLTVWKKSVELSLRVYKLTAAFPKEEIYGLTSQMRRASVSVPSNIAEGSIRGSKKEFCHFLRISSGSVAELRTQLEISKNLNFANLVDYKTVDDLAMEVNKMIHGLIGKLES